MTLMDRYTNYYKPLLRSYCKNLVEQMPADAFHGIPHPFIPAWGTRYEQAIVKMAIIGLETRGWNPTLPEYIRHVQNEQWESSFDISEFQNLDYVDWTSGKGSRYTFWGFVMYFLAALYGVKNWEILKRREYANILNSFLWGNATAIERWESGGIPEGTNPKAHQIARNAAYELNDFKHLQTIFAPDVSIIMCGKGPCHQFLRNIDKELLWEKDNVCLWKAGESFIFNMPHPNNMKFNYGADFYAKTIREGLSAHGLFHPMPEFIDCCDKEAERLLDTFFSKCKSQAHNTKEAVAFIATELRKQNATMTVRMLCNILNKLGYRTTYGSEYVAGRGSYKMVAGAWNYYLKQPDIAKDIALAFTKPNGDYAYWDY